MPRSSFISVRHSGALRCDSSLVRCSHLCLFPTDGLYLPIKHGRGQWDETSAGWQPSSGLHVVDRALGGHCPKPRVPFVQTKGQVVSSAG